MTFTALMSCVWLAVLILMLRDWRNDRRKHMRYVLWLEMRMGLWESQPRDSAPRHQAQ